MSDSLGAHRESSLSRYPDVSLQWDQSSTDDSEESVRRITVRQLWNAVRTNENTPFRCTLDGVDMKRVVLIANLQSSGSEPSEWYMLDDGTGRIKAFIGQYTDPIYTYEQFAYARVVGILQFNVNGEQRSLSVLNMAPVHDPYEIYFQILHAIYDSVKCNRGSLAVESDSSSRTYQRGVSLSNENNHPSTSHRRLPDTNHRSGRIRVRSSLERDIIIFISDNDEGYGVSLENLVMYIRTYRPDANSAAFQDAIRHLLINNIVKTVDSDQDYFQLGDRFNDTD